VLQSFGSWIASASQSPSFIASYFPAFQPSSLQAFQRPVTASHLPNFLPCFHHPLCDALCAVLIFFSLRCLMLNRFRGVPIFFTVLTLDAMIYHAYLALEIFMLYYFSVLTDYVIFSYSPDQVAFYLHRSHIKVLRSASERCPSF
jgi:hypothetical protein